MTEIMPEIPIINYTVERTRESEKDWSSWKWWAKSYLLIAPGLGALRIFLEFPLLRNWGRY